MENEEKGLIVGASNEDYHANRTHLSSSQLKLILEDPARFYNEVVLGNKEQSDSDVFTEGHLTHTLILEPEKVQAEYAVFQGLRRSGNAYQEFLEKEAKGRKPVTAAMFLRCEARAKAHFGHKTAAALMEGGLSEHTMIAELLDVPVKARADRIRPETGIIIDVKTTSMPSGIEFFKDTVKQYAYDLSAALYCKIAEATYARPFDFYWEVHSKADQGLEIYKMSAATRGEGNGKVTQALQLYKRCKETGLWELGPQKLNHTGSDDYEILEV